MSIESRVSHLLRAAERADKEGNARLATILRRMAEELRPIDGNAPGPPMPLSSS